MRILVVEDYPPLARSLARGLQEAGYAVDTVADGEEALAFAESASYDAILLDLMLPKLGGEAVLERLRRSRNPAAVLILTARDGVEDRVKGLDLGADDYLVKPFAFEELLARVRALIRRRYGRPDGRICIANLEIDTVARSVARGGALIDLSAREYAVLEYLATRHDQIVTRTEILEHVYDFAAELSSNVIDVYVSYLRKKIDRGRGVQLLHTRRGQGYMLGARP